MVDQPDSGGAPPTPAMPARPDYTSAAFSPLLARLSAQALKSYFWSESSFSRDVGLTRYGEVVGRRGGGFGWWFVALVLMPANCLFVGFCIGALLALLPLFGAAVFGFVTFYFGVADVVIKGFAIATLTVFAVSLGFGGVLALISVVAITVWPRFASGRAFAFLDQDCMPNIIFCGASRFDNLTICAMVKPGGSGSAVRRCDHTKVGNFALDRKSESIAINWMIVDKQNGCHRSPPGASE